MRTRRAIIKVSHETLRERLGFDKNVSIIAVFPPDLGVFRPGYAHVLIEGEDCPEVVEGCAYPTLDCYVDEDGKTSFR